MLKRLPVRWMLLLPVWPLLRLLCQRPQVNSPPNLRLRRFFHHLLVPVRLKRRRHHLRRFSKSRSDWRRKLSCWSRSAKSCRRNMIACNAKRRLKRRL